MQKIIGKSKHLILQFEFFFHPYLYLLKEDLKKNSNLRPSA